MNTNSKGNRRYIYPAIFNPEGKGYNVSFPDVDGAFTCGDSLEEAMSMAKDCLELSLDSLEKIPKVSDLKKIKLHKNDFLVLIEADMISFRKKYDNQTIKKTLTLPKWLNDLGVSKKINFSKLLQNELKKVLNVENE